MKTWGCFPCREVVMASNPFPVEVQAPCVSVRPEAVAAASANQLSAWKVATLPRPCGARLALWGLPGCRQPQGVKVLTSAPLAGVGVAGARHWRVSARVPTVWAVFRGDVAPPRADVDRSSRGQA